MVMIIAVVLIAALMVLSFTACQTAASGQTQQETATETTAVQETTATTQQEVTGTTEGGSSSEIALVDGVGNEVMLDGPAKKVIVFVPSALEIMDGLGAMDMVIGVDNWSVDNGEPLAEGFEGFGDFSGLNMEKIAAADPDMIIGLIGWAEEDINKLSELGIALYIVDVNTIEEVYTEITNMGKMLGKDDRAAQVNSDLKKNIDAITEKVSGIPDDERPGVFYEVWNDPLMSAGSQTFINELIEYAGGKNIVAGDGLEGWPEYSIENLIQNNPEVIIAPESLAPDAETILADQRLSELDAVKNKRVYVVPDNPVSRPSQNVIKGLTMFAQAIHPELFGDFEVQY